MQEQGYNTPWHCPVCQKVLVLSANKTSWCCENKHVFDRAKEGYVNLLLPQQRNSKSPGDNAAMVKARRDFLSSGHYLPLAKKLAQLIDDIDSHTQDIPYIFYAGCGEGYYLNALSQLLGHTHNNRFAGVDISKKAVQKAAKQNPSHSFAVASTFKLPVLNQSQDCVIQIFAPSKPEELHRILKKEAYWIAVNPHLNHLQQLKSLVYDKPALHELSQVVPVGFRSVGRHRLSFDLSLEDLKQRENLLMMTPYYWTISNEKKALLKSSLQEISADFDIQVFQKT